MRRSKRFILVGMEAHQNVEMGGSNEMFESIEELKKYIKYNNYRSEYLGVFDKVKGEEFSVSEFV